MKKTALCISLLLFSISCAGDFSMVKDGAVGGNTALALVPGTPFPATIAMLRLLSRELEKNPSLRVIPFGEKPGPRMVYPRGPYKTSLLEIDIDEGLTDREALERLRQETGADMVFVLWTPVENRMEVVPRRGHTLLDEVVTVETLHGLARLYRFPGAEPVGRGDFTLEFTDTDRVPCRGLAENLPPVRSRVMKEWAVETAKVISRGMSR